MWATWPRQCLCSGQRGGEPAETGRRAPSHLPQWSSGSPRLAGPRRRGRWPRCSIISTHRPLRLAQARAPASSASASPPGSPRWLWPQAFGLDVEAVEEVWHGIGPPSPILRLGRRARPQPPRRTCPCSGPSCSPMRSRSAASRSTIIRPSGIGTESASSWSAPAAKRGSTAAPATIFGQLSRRGGGFLGDGVLDGELLVGARRRARRSWRRGGQLQRAPAEARPQDGSTRCWPTILPSSGSTTSCSTA